MAVLSINKNIQSLQAQRRLDQASAGVAQSYERLSSGLRINRPSDDAASLSVASKLEVDSRVFNQGTRNLNDGISLVNVAEGAIQSLSTILNRLKELTTQAANGTYSLQQRTALDTEAYALTNEFNRVVAATKYNGVKLIDGSLGNLSIQAGYGTDGQISFALGEALDHGVGDGTFQAAITITSGAGVTDPILIDVNNDGKADLITGVSGGVQLRLGNGDGTFQSATTVSTASQNTLVSGDFNNDGKVDLALALNAGGVAILNGNGDGTFTAVQTVGVGTQIYNIKTGDFNGDGNLDIVAVNGNSAAVNNLFILSNNGNGTFGSSVSYDLGLDYMVQGAFGALAVGDVNGDGKLDITLSAYSNNYSLSSLATYLGKGDGTFGSPVSDTSGYYGEVNLVDINHDGREDVVSTDGSGVLFYAYGQANGTFGASHTLSTGGAQVITQTIADLNGDGIYDIIASPNDGTYRIFIGKSDGTFNSGTTATAGGSSFSLPLTVGDVNGDGATDIVGKDAGASTKVYILRGNATDVSTIARLDLTSRQDALASLGVVNSTFDLVTAELGAIGAAQSRYSSALAALSAARDNSTAAKSRITDSDVAQESASLVKNQILQQAATAVLAQANAAPKLALKLLQSAGNN